MNQPNDSQPRQPPLQVTIVPGMTVVEADDGTSGTILGITDAHCIFRVNQTNGLAVAAWPKLALANVRPAKPLLPADIEENDRRNARATVLRELLELEQFGLTGKQSAAMSELIDELCGST